MRKFDRLLQSWRARVARPWIPRGAKVLDIGSHQGEFLQSLGDHIGPSVGLDPLGPAESYPRYRLLPEAFRALSDRYSKTPAPAPKPVAPAGGAAAGVRALIGRRR